jgi:DNA-binding response OmpR family regulator
MARILLIEPDYLLATTYGAALQTGGHELVVRAGAQSAVFAADETTPDLVILELQLIEHSGIEFLYEFRSYPDWQTVPVLILSHVPPAEFDASRDLLTRELGVQAYHYKPYTSLRRLLTAVNELVSTTA